MPWAAAAAAVVGAGIQASSARRAAKGQRAAEDAAVAEQARQFDLAREDQAPYRDIGVEALQDLRVLKDEFGRPVTAESVMAEPGYQFGLQQGIGNIEGTAAARGGLYSGAALRELTRYGGDYATGRYGEAFNRQQALEGNRWNRLAGLAGVGQTATQQSAAAGRHYADRFGNLRMRGAEDQGASRIAQGNIWSDLINQGGAWAGRRGGRVANTGGSGYTPYDPDVSNNPFGLSGLADGGPVRVRPEAPRSLSREDVLRAIREQAEKAPGTLSAAPPGAGLPSGAPAPGLGLDDLLRAFGFTSTERRKKQIDTAVDKSQGYWRGGKVRMGYEHGGRVSGPGGPRDDMVMARLSDGEHVMDAASVNGIGGGDNERGQRRLNALRAVARRAY